MSLCQVCFGLNYIPKYTIGPNAAPKTHFKLPMMWLAESLAAPLPTAVLVTDAELRTEVEDATFGAEVIVALVVDFVRLPTLPVAEISGVVVAATSLKALKDASPAVIWTGMKGGGPHKLFS
jgi:hypothetical protein